ncbi:hypothetical protein PRB81_gp71 [Klebsiella phage VLCpiS13f]|uniref:hypothetical protein n=1 Tax=Klebsiella phage VLCpiS13f TaxID=2874890 RepID=UPI00233ECAAD|nr:hypothetical protein PRB81_gp71 [Klebsiella phage VLCpiS13f]UVX29534.1 hypothetical protein S13f_00025 [Klebsiella phage VLCpiS13f]
MTHEQFIEKNLRDKLPGIDNAAIEAALQRYRQCRSVTGKAFDEMLYIAKQHYIKNRK